MEKVGTNPELNSFTAKDRGHLFGSTFININVEFNYT